MSEEESRRTGTREVSPIDVYMLLPKTNCKLCGEENCMAFAAKLVNRELSLDKCSPLLEKENEVAYKRLWELLKPPIREVSIGPNGHSVKVGGKYVMYRHEFSLTNPTAIAIDVTDEMSADEQVKRIRTTQEFHFEYIGKTLKLDMIAIRSTSNDPEKFKAAVKNVAENTRLPLILCSLDPHVMEAGLKAAPKAQPLIYAATKDNWKSMADLALAYHCPLAALAPNDLRLLKSLAKTLTEYSVNNLVLDPGTSPREGLADTISNFTMVRRAAAKRGDELLGFPLIGAPIAAWLENNGAPEEIKKWNEAYLTAILINRYADLLILHSTEGWVLLPNVVLRQNIYTDPRKPVAVEPGLRAIGHPDGNSPVMFTTNFALTYYTVTSDIESAGLDTYLLVVDSEGIAVDCAVAGRKLTADKVAEALRQTKIEEKVNHRKLIIPGKAARLSGEIEEACGWEIMVGPRDSSDIPKYLQEKWTKS